MSVSVDLVVFASGNVESIRLLPGQDIVVKGRLAASNRLGLEAAVLSTHDRVVVVSGPSWWQTAAGELRSGLREASSGLPPAVAGLLPGLAIGDTSELTFEVDDDFRDTGMTHLLAVSGSNLAIVVGAVLLLTRAARAPVWLTVVVGMVAILGFVILVRPSPSVLRAAAMGVIGLLALGTGRPTAAIPALSATVVVLLWWEPGLAFDLGFGLSVSATLGLVVFASRWTEAGRRRGVPRLVAAAIAVPAAAQLAVSPLLAAADGGINIIAVPANALAAVAVPPAAILGVVATVASAVSMEVATVIAWLASWPVRWLIVVAETGAAIPGGVVSWPAGPGWSLFLVVVVLALLLVLRKRRGRRLLVLVVVALCLLVIPTRSWWSAWPPPGWVMVVCDVGQGDAVVLSVGQGEAIVVDTGPDPELMDGCLDRLGVRRVPLLVITHAHMDHVGGLSGVYSGREVGGILVPGDLPAGEAEDRFAEAASASRRWGPSVGDGFTVGEVTLSVLSGSSAGLDGPNNASIVLRAETHGVSVLLTGDIEEETQQRLLADGSGIAADVLKVPHHGSANGAPGFIEAVGASLAVISVGEDNGYGHPHRSIVDRLKRGGARVERTDRSGDIALVVGKEGMSVATTS